MNKKVKTANDICAELIQRYPVLKSCKAEILSAYKVIKDSYINGGKLLIAGNGGSASDSEHIVGELMKSFLFHRAIDETLAEKLEKEYGKEGQKLSEKLEGALSAIPLTSMPALTSAFANDVDSTVDFAQKLNGYGNKGDVFFGISTSGNSKNIISALMVAHAKEIHTILLSGGNGGKCANLADISICVPETETFKIQELHLPVYHAICSMLEADFFEENNR